MKTILKILLTAIVVVGLADLLAGITVTNYATAIVVAIVLGLFRVFVKPMLIVFTLPITIITFGLFIFVINAIIIHLVGYFVTGFEVNGIFTAIIFSLLLTISQTVLYPFLKEEKR